MISVVIPVRNCADWIEEAILSVHLQSRRPMEILVADDGSVDGTAERVLSMGIPGVRLLPGAHIRGISAQMNRLAAEARGRFLARMDGDDVSHSRRFEVQIAFMEKNGLSVVGSWSRRFGGSRTLHRFGRTDGILKAGMLFSTPFCNPTTIMDRDRFGGKFPPFDESVLAAGDYRYWVDHRASGTYGNVQEVLVDWRMHERNVGTDPATHGLQLRNASRVRDDLLRDYGLDLDPPGREVLEKRARGISLDLPDTRRFLEVLLAIRRVPVDRMRASPAEVDHVLLGHWNLSCLLSAWNVPSIPRLWWRGSRLFGSRPDSSKVAKILAKSVLGRCLSHPGPARRN